MSIAYRQNYVQSSIIQRSLSGNKVFYTKGQTELRLSAYSSSSSKMSTVGTLLLPNSIDEYPHCCRDNCLMRLSLSHKESLLRKMLILKDYGFKRGYKKVYDGCSSLAETREFQS